MKRERLTDEDDAEERVAARPRMPITRRAKIAAAAVLAAVAWGALYWLGVAEGMTAKGLAVAEQASADGEWLMAGAAAAIAYGTHVLPAACLLYLLVAVQAAAGRRTWLMRVLLPRMKEVKAAPDDGPRTPPIAKDAEFFRKRD